MADDKTTAGKRGAAMTAPLATPASKAKSKVRIDAAPVATMTAMPAPSTAGAALPPLVTPVAPPAPTGVERIADAVSAALEPAIMPITAAPPAVPPAVVATPAPIPPAIPQKDPIMNETINEMSANATNTIKTGTETAYANGKAALDQVTTKSKEAIEHGMKSIDEMTTMARGNVEALLASTRAATTGLETIAHQVADFSRKHFEETTAAARAMTTVKTPNELMQLQNDFAKTQFDAAISEMSKLSETLVKLAGEVFEPMQNRVALATDKLKSAATTSFKM